MTEKPARFQIAPDTRVGALLDCCPELEKVLIEMSPAFAHLRNPLLRRTVAKVATLRQVAKVGNIPLGELINRLRRASGADYGEWNEDEASNEGDAPPLWVKNGKVVHSFDARPLIESGGHPMAQVLDDIKNLKPGEVYEFLTPFVPVPLLDIIKGKGYLCWSQASEPGVFRNYVGVAAGT